MYGDLLKSERFAEMVREDYPGCDDNRLRAFAQNSEVRWATIVVPEPPFWDAGDTTMHVMVIVSERGGDMTQHFTNLILASSTMSDDASDFGRWCQGEFDLAHFEIGRRRLMHVQYRGIARIWLVDAVVHLDRRIASHIDRHWLRVLFEPGEAGMVVQLPDIEDDLERRLPCDDRARPDSPRGRGKIDWLPRTAPTSNAPCHPRLMPEGRVTDAFERVVSAIAMDTSRFHVDSAAWIATHALSTADEPGLALRMHAAFRDWCRQHRGDEAPSSETLWILLEAITAATRVGDLQQQRALIDEALALARTRADAFTEPLAKALAKIGRLADAFALIDEPGVDDDRDPWHLRSILDGAREHGHAQASDMVGAALAERYPWARALLLDPPSLRTRRAAERRRLMDIGELDAAEALLDATETDEVLAIRAMAARRLDIARRMVERNRPFAADPNRYQELAWINVAAALGDDAELWRQVESRDDHSDDWVELLLVHAAHLAATRPPGAGAALARCAAVVKAACAPGQICDPHYSAGRLLAVAVIARDPHAINDMVGRLTAVSDDDGDDDPGSGFIGSNARKCTQILATLELSTDAAAMLEKYSVLIDNPNFLVASPLMNDAARRGDEALIRRLDALWPHVEGRSVMAAQRLAGICAAKNGNQRWSDLAWFL